MAQRCPGRGVIDQTGNREDLRYIHVVIGEPGAGKHTLRNSWLLMSLLLSPPSLSGGTPCHSSLPSTMPSPSPVGALPLRTIHARHVPHTVGCCGWGSKGSDTSEWRRLGKLGKWRCWRVKPCVHAGRVNDGPH